MIATANSCFITNSIKQIVNLFAEWNPLMRSHFCDGFPTRIRKELQRVHSPDLRKASSIAPLTVMATAISTHIPSASIFPFAPHTSSSLGPPSLSRTFLALPQVAQSNLHKSEHGIYETLSKTSRFPQNQSRKSKTISHVIKETGLKIVVRVHNFGSYPQIPFRDFLHPKKIIFL